MTDINMPPRLSVSKFGVSDPVHVSDSESVPLAQFEHILWMKYADRWEQLDATGRRSLVKQEIEYMKMLAEHAKTDTTVV